MDNHPKRLVAVAAAGGSARKIHNEPKVSGSYLLSEKEESPASFGRCRVSVADL